MSLTIHSIIFISLHRSSKGRQGKRLRLFMKETLSDIISQSIRVKGIVSDLLEFARGRDLQIREVELNSLITAAYKSLGYSMNLNKIRFVLNSDPNGVVIYADPEQLERVFINLFTNAFDAMNGKGGPDCPCGVRRKSCKGKNIRHRQRHV